MLRGEGEGEADVRESSVNRKVKRVMRYILDVKSLELEYLALSGELMVGRCCLKVNLEMDESTE